MLKTVIESTEGLDEALVPLYAEKDGKFVLQIEGVDAHPDVANLKSAYERVKEDRETIRTERDTLKAKAAKGETVVVPAEFCAKTAAAPKSLKASAASKPTGVKKSW